MTNFPLSNVLLPAVCVSSAVFSTLTLPFALIESEPIVVELPPFFSGEIQPIFNGEHREVAIPYVGFAIVVSVGAGIASVEVNRRWQAYRESTQLEATTPQVNANGATAQPQPLKAWGSNPGGPMLRPEHPAFKDPTHVVPDTMLPEQQLSVDSDEPIMAEPIVAITQLKTPQRFELQAFPVTTVSPPQSVWSQGLVRDRFEQESPTDELEPSRQTVRTPNKLLVSPLNYQTCRITVPDVKHCRFAICVEGKYYSFLRAETTEAKLQDILAKLGESLPKAVITKTPKSYIAWTWEPEATPKLAA